MGRSPCCSDEEVKKGPWTSEEDDKLCDYIRVHGHCSWREISRLAGLNRCGKSCRLRWTNYLRPDIKRGKFDEDEEEKIIHLHAKMGNKWSAIASKLPGRTDNEIKNHWNTHLRKKLMKKGIDPVSHKQSPELTLMAALRAELQGGNGANPAAFNPLQLQAELAQWAKIQLAESVILVLNALNSPASAAAAAPHNSVGALKAAFNQLPEIQGGLFGNGSFVDASGGAPSVIHGRPTQTTGVVTPAAAAMAMSSLSSLSQLPCFSPHPVVPHLIDYAVTAKTGVPTQRQNGFCPKSDALTAQNPNRSRVVDAITWSNVTSAVPLATDSTALQAPQMDALDSLMAELDIPSADITASPSDASVSSATPSEDDFFSFNFHDDFILEDVSSWPSTGFNAGVVGYTWSWHKIHRRDGI